MRAESAGQRAAVNVYAGLPAQAAVGHQLAHRYRAVRRGFGPPMK